MTKNTLYTIGHSTHQIKHFLCLLKVNEIEIVADVRSSPFSSYSPQFNRGELKSALNSAGVKYLYMGDALGARSQDQSCYVDGRVSYHLLRKTDAFQTAIQRLRTGAKEHRIALMCSEREPLECHRTILIAPALEDCGVRIRHISADGTTVSHAEALERLMSAVGVPTVDLFRSRQELISDALKRQESRIAYRPPADKERASQ